MARAESTDPTVSNGWVAPSRVLGTKSVVTVAETATSTIGSRNVQRQVSTSTMNADTYRPIMPPLPANPAHRPIARARSSGGKVDVMTDSVTGMIIAAPAPDPMRATIITVALGATAATAADNPNSTRPAWSTGLRPQRSPMAPTGMSRAASASV